MKKLLFYVSMLVLGTVSYSQVNYYDKDKNPISTGDCDIDALGVTITIPEAVKSYEKISIAAIYAKNWASSDGYSVYEKEYDQGVLTPGKKDFWIKKPGGGSDFVSGGYTNPPLDIQAPCKDVNRRESSYTVSIRILGGTHSGWETVNDGYSTKTVKTYDYSVIVAYDDQFVMDFGGAATDLTSKNGTYTIGFPFPDDTQTYLQEYIQDEPFKKGEMTYLKFYDPEDDKYNSIEVKIIVEKKSNAAGWSVDKIKEDIIKGMIYSTNKSSMYRNSFDKSTINWERNLVSEKGWFYPGFAKKYGKSGDKEFDAQFIAMSENPISWKEENGWHQLIFDKIYYSGHLGSTKEKPYVLAEYKNGGGSFLHFYVKETDSHFITVGIYKELKKLKYEGLTANEAKFINETIAGIAIK